MDPLPAPDAPSPDALPLLASAVSDAVLLADREGSIIYMNDEAGRLTDTDPAAARGLYLEELFSLVLQPDRSELHPLELIAGSEGLCGGIPPLAVLVRSDGTETPVAGSVLSMPGGSLALVMRDLRAGWRIDRYLQRTQKSEALRVLAEGIAQSLDDLLTVLLARTGMIRSQQGDEEAVLRSLEEIERVVGRISSMTSGLLTGAGSPPGDEGVARVGRVLESVRHTISAGHPEARIEMAFPERTGYAEISGDLLEQVVLNLMQNAAEATGGEGRILATACRLDLEEEMPPIAPGRYVLLSVMDEGDGIAPDDLMKVFDPFFSTKGRGRGLGLSAVYSIVHSHGGYVVIGSERGAWTRLSVYLPMSEALEMESAGDRIPVVRLSGLSRKASERLSRILSALGCSVTGVPVEGESPDLGGIAPDMVIAPSEEGEDLTVVVTAGGSERLQRRVAEDAGMELLAELVASACWPRTDVPGDVTEDGA